MDMEKILCDHHDDVRKFHIDELRDAVAMLAFDGDPFREHFIRHCQAEIERRATVASKRKKSTKPS